MLEYKINRNDSAGPGIEQRMTELKLTKVAMASRMKTSRAALDRLLDPSNRSVTLQTLERAASVLGKQLQIVLV